MQTTSLSAPEMSRYLRQMTLPELGWEGQQKLKSAKVLVVGAGGLGSPMLLYLAAAGVGELGIADFDVVDESNLHRQILFGIKDLGKAKTSAARRRLLDLNPNIKIRQHRQKLTAATARRIVKNYDLVADGSDNFPTRYALNDACVQLGKPLVFGAVNGFEGQVSVFNFLEKTGRRGPNYRDLFPVEPPPNSIPNCAEAGVLGPVAGVVGSLQATEVLKILAGMGEPLSGRLLVFDALRGEFRIFKIPAKQSVSA